MLTVIKIIRKNRVLSSCRMYKGLGERLCCFAGIFYLRKQNFFRTNYSRDFEVSAQRASKKFLQNILLPKGAIVFHIISQKISQTLERGDNIIGVGVGKVFLSDHQDGCKSQLPSCFYFGSGIIAYHIRLLVF